MNNSHNLGGLGQNMRGSTKRRIAISTKLTIIAERVALGIQYSAGASLKRVRITKAAVNRKLTGLLTPHSELTAVRDMAAPAANIISIFYEQQLERNKNETDWS